MVIETPPRHGDPEPPTTPSSNGSSSRPAGIRPRAHPATGARAEGADPCVAPGSFNRAPEPDVFGPALRRVRDHARVFGVKAVVGYALGKIVPALGRRLGPPADRFDQRFGVDTDGYEPLTIDEVPSDSAQFVEGATPYQPTHERVLADVFAQLPDGFESATFVDLGCGRGRALIEAARHPFARILGIELSERHAEAARTNVATFLENHEDDTRCPNIEVVCADAGSLPLPDGPLYLFAFNPFPADTLASILERAARGASEPRRSITLATVNVTLRDASLRAIGFETVRHVSPLVRWWSWSLIRYPANDGARRRGA